MIKKVYSLLFNFLNSNTKIIANQNNLYKFFNALDQCENESFRPFRKGFGFN